MESFITQLIKRSFIMLRYSKTLSLALLFSLPAIAMEKQLVGPLTQEEAVADQESPDLTSTIVTSEKYLKELARLEQVEKQRADLDQKATEIREARNMHLEDLLEKKKKKEGAIDGAKTVVADLTAKLLALDLQKEQKAKEIAAEKEKQATEFAAEVERQTKELTTQKEKALKDQQELEAALTTISETINKADKKDAPVEAPKTGGRWYFFWLK